MSSKLCHILFSLMAASASLYPEALLQISSSQQFQDFAYKKENAFFVQFYSSKDSKSVSFASTWKKTFENVAGWSGVVQLVAVDCDLDANANLCEEHKINSYPTLKYFKYHSTDAKDSVLFEGKKNTVADLATAIARFVVTDYGTQKPSTWPDFSLAHNNNPSDNTWPPETHYMALVFETYPPGETTLDKLPAIGAQVILDFSSDKNVFVRRGTDKHIMARANDVKDFPGLLMFSRSHEGSPVHVSSVSKESSHFAISSRQL